MYQIITVPYCEPLSSPLLEAQRAFPPSHSRAFVDAFLSSHLGFTDFVRNFVSFSSGTHISWGVCNDGISDWGLFVRLNVSEGGWFSSLVTSR